MVSLLRTVRSIQRVGLREWWRQMQYIGDAKSGTYVGKDQFGNRYYENCNQYEEVPGRHRWVDLAQHNYHASQVPPEWHSWLQHIRENPPHKDPVMLNSSPPWKAPWIENLTGTRGAYRPYNTVPPKISSWEPKVTSRS
ncbi:NADH dehydrogenase [ubiquinone] 1 alpha subcomplex subunit 12 [Termitomyces sp. T112]|nr:hypothetical protein C0989_003122 [Termitomyces sp. Mn162]KAG5735685.1 NADH dehydrogenase [ubiquinone] 1 alpha subcomplex subunit 12 [Termitomyces sp. T112]KAH0587109.1 hypothetical protein H2248_005926 [Termitomyces sp. 'cryptogamus']